MTTYVDTAVSEIIPEPEPNLANESGGDPRWDEADRMAQTLTYLQALKLRTQAEGFDD